LQSKLIGAGISGGIGAVKLQLQRICTDSLILEQALSGPQFSKDALSSKLYDAMYLAQAGATDERIRKEIGARAFVNQSYAFTCAMIFKHLNSLEGCIENIINQGGDCDTTGAMAGAVMGAAYGYKAFPIRWKRGLEDKKRLLKLADNLWRKVI
jgi:ADP-ribosylglycohydrolase